MKIQFKAAQSALQLMAFAVTFVFASVSGFANPIADKTAHVSRKVAVDADFTRLEINGDVTVILTHQPSDSIRIEGNAKDVSRISAAVSNGKLAINANRKAGITKTFVYVSASQLNMIQVNGDAEIISAEAIGTEGIEIILNGNSLVNVTSKEAGKIKVRAGEEFELTRY